MGVKNILFSYYYFRSQLNARSGDASLLLRTMREAKGKGFRFMLDSGAFTYHMKGEKMGSRLPSPKKYVEEYLTFVKEHGDLFDVIVEFDVDGSIADPDRPGQMITTAQVDDWSNTFLSVPGVAERYMPVFHAHRGKNWLDAWLAETVSPYVGVASSLNDGVAGIIARCHQWGKFVHGFAQTGVHTTLKYAPFDSVDSTTWLRADKYGGTCIYMNGKWIVLDHLHKADRARYRRWYENWGLDFSLIAKDDLQENRLATIVAWRELANSFERKGLMKQKPYLWQLMQEGKVFLTHPYVTAKKRKGDDVG
jgi:hypothetical protein